MLAIPAGTKITGAADVLRYPWTDSFIDRMFTEAALKSGILRSAPLPELRLESDEVQFTYGVSIVDDHLMVSLIETKSDPSPSP